MKLRYDTKNTSNKRKNKLDIIKIKNFCASMDTIKKVKTNQKMGESICKLYI